MSFKKIDVGNLPNDGTGDDLREAFVKINENFEFADTKFESFVVKGENLGDVGEGVYAGQSDEILQFKRIQPGKNVSLSSNPNSITIDASGGLENILVLSDNGSLTVNNNNYLAIKGDKGIKTRVSGNNVFLDLENKGIVERDENPKLSASLRANNKNIQNAGTVSAEQFIGNLNGLVNGIDINEIYQYFEENSFDFGGITNNYKNAIEFIIGEFDFDMGNITDNFDRFEIDLGTIN